MNSKHSFIMGIVLGILSVFVFFKGCSDMGEKVFCPTDYEVVQSDTTVTLTATHSQEIDTIHVHHYNEVEVLVDNTPNVIEDTTSETGFLREYHSVHEDSLIKAEIYAREDRDWETLGVLSTNTSTSL